MVGLGVWKTRGQQNKRGDPPIFFRTPSRGGVRKKKWGAKRKGGARTPRTPPEYASDLHFRHHILTSSIKLRLTYIIKFFEEFRFLYVRIR